MSFSPFVTAYLLSHIKNYVYSRQFMNKPILYASLLWSKLQNQINYFKEGNIVALQVLSVLQKTEEEKQKESSNSSEGIFLFIMTFNQDVEPQNIPQIPTRRLETFLIFRLV